MPEGTPSGCPWPRIPPARTEALQAQGLRGAPGPERGATPPGPARPRHLPPCVQAPSKLMMFLCFPIIFIISISDTRSDRSLSVASSVPGGRVSSSGTPQPTQVPLAVSLLTFQHLHCHCDGSGSTVLVDANGLRHDHLAKAALSKRLAQGQPRSRGPECAPWPNTAFEAWLRLQEAPQPYPVP